MMKKHKKDCSLQLDGLTEYEKMKIKRLESNDKAMKARGFSDNLASHILNQTRARAMRQQVLDEEEDEEEPDYHPNDEENVENLLDDTLLENDKEIGKRKKGLCQTMPMTEFAMLRLQQKTHQSKIMGQHSSQHQQKVKSQMKTITDKKVSKALAMQASQSADMQYCLPGSQNSYLEMRRRQLDRKQKGVNKNVEEFCLSEKETGVGMHDQEDNNGMTSNQRESSNAADELLIGHDATGGDDVAMENVLQIDNNRQKIRGPTKLLSVHTRPYDERELIILNEDGVLVGPSKASIDQFRRFLGTIAKDPWRAPLNYVTWKYVPDHKKEEIWKFVKEKYIIPDEAKKYVLATVNSLWRTYKSRLHDTHYSPYETDDERKKNHPVGIPPKQFTDLIDYWSSEAFKHLSDTNKKNREMQDDVHTMGPSSYALLRHDLQQKHPEKRPPTQAQVYKESRKRVPGREYKTIAEKYLDNVEKMDILQELNEHEDGDNSTDPYFDVMTKEHSGRLRLRGRCVTK